MLREPNNYNQVTAAGWKRLAAAVVQTYGHKYQRSVDYLTGLANNLSWQQAELPDIPWLSARNAGPSEGEPRYIMHESLMNAIAPAVPLRAIFSRGPRG